MGREGNAVGLTKSTDTQKLADSAAAGRIGLKDVNRIGIEHAAKISEIVTVLAGGDFHSGWFPGSQGTEAHKVIGRDRLLEPCNSAVCKDPRLRSGKFNVVCRVCIHEKLHPISDGGARFTNADHISGGIASDLHFDAGDPLLNPSSELCAKLGD